LIIKEAWALCKKGMGYLMNIKLSDEEENRIIEIIESHKGELLDFHKLKTRKSGNMRYIDFHITVEPELSVSKAHALVGELKKELCDEFKVTRVSVHIDPNENTHDTLSDT
jgi:divalent metal cation (Fe/Co/Zn/Cd) transporter